MYTLFILADNYTNGYNIEFLDILSLLSILCGIFVIISKNPIISVLFLIGLFLCISSYLILLGINFIGLSYLLVYIGAVSILFLFILMLINVRISELQAESSNSLPLAIIIGICFYSILHEILPSNNENINNVNTNNRDIIKNEMLNIFHSSNNIEEIAYVTSQL
jgi:NADH-ubiquinone oxidoreductase chain 6